MSFREITPKQTNKHSEVVAPDQKDNGNLYIEKLMASKTKIAVSTSEKTFTTSLQEIIASSQKSQKTIIFTLTPGPFKSKEEMPKGWMDTPEAVGCTAQLEAFEKALLKSDLDADIYAINNKTADYQCGQNGLLAAKKFTRLSMISDAESKLQAELGLPTIKVDNQVFHARLTIVVKPTGQAKVFLFNAKSVNPIVAAEHIAQIKTFLTASLTAQPRVPFICP